MSIRTRTCIEAACDDCGSDCWADADYGTPHFASVEEALADLVKHYEWTVGPDGQLCRHCVAKRLCEAKGHEWGGWVEWLTGGIEGVRSRFCNRDYCDGHEQEPTPPAPESATEGAGGEDRG